MNIPASRLDRGFLQYQTEFEEKALEVLRSGWYILGKELSSFEEEFGSYLGSDHVVGLNSGLDALILAFRALGVGVGDEVLVQGNTYIASVMGISVNGATPVFVEPNQYHNLDVSDLERKITSKTKAILVVHLYGQSSDMDGILALSRKHDLFVVEDCAQSHGATVGGQMTGTLGDIGCFSFFPTKNLGAFGDGGCIATSSPDLAEKIRTLRNYGSRQKYYFEEVGVNSRLDEMQAGLLRVSLSHMEEMVEERRRLATFYSKRIKNPCVTLPQVAEGATAVWHQYVILCPEREKLMAYLGEKGIGTLIHYPQPPHLSQAYGYLEIPKGSLPKTEQLSHQVLSLPFFIGMTREEQDYVVNAVNEFHL